MILRKGLFLILVLALLSVPVLLAAHVLTHFAHVDTISTSPADSAQNESDTDADRVCLDCLALTAFGVALPLLAFLFVARMLRQQLPPLKHRPILRDFSSPYLTRAPPLA
ncbi:MAG: hypothetical protein AABY81_08590 [Pseudomonadota bacterium]